MDEKDVETPWLRDMRARLYPNSRKADCIVTMRSISLQELWATEGPNLRRGFRARQRDLSPYLDLETCEAATRTFTKWLQKAARAEFDKARDKRPRGLRLDDRKRSGGHLVAVDSEGANFGAPVKRGAAEYQPHHSILWMAGGAQGFKDVELRPAPGRQWLSSEEICSFLTSLPRKFMKAGSNEPAPSFISFAFGYDVGQIVRDMPYEKAWELMHGLPWKAAWSLVDGKWRRKQRPTSEPNFNRSVYWKGFTLSYRPRKSITIARLKDRNNPSRPVKRKGADHVSLETQFEPGTRIQIYDTFHFFQMSFLKALAGMPEDIVTPQEKEIIAAGKKDRGRFKAENLETIARYTGLELKALVRVIDEIRNALLNAIPNRPIVLKDLWGAGAIASAVLDSYFEKKNVRAILGEIDETSEQLQWARCAFFGGRIDPPMSGVTKRDLPEYDLTSAYPFFISQLPSMEGGRWEFKQNPSREEIEQSSMLSMFEVHTSGCNPDLPFYPLPWRREHGAILFPRNVDGQYMRDDVIGAFRWFDTFTRRGDIGNYGLEPLGPQMRVTGGWFFKPANPDEKPFAFILELFKLRAEIMAKDPNDVRAQVLKLAINAIYGKLAQSVGRKGRPPKWASPWMAAAITAGTRRMALEAALKDPDAIVRFATDAVQSTRPLDIVWTNEKILGEWMQEIAIGGGVLVKSGMFCLPAVAKPGKIPKLKLATRGYSPENVEGDADDHFSKVVDDLMVKIPEAWARGDKDIAFKYRQYMNLGFSIASRETWKFIGCWKRSDRTLDLNDYGQKRNAPSTAKKRQSRASKLVRLPVAHRDPIMEEDRMSAPYTYEWLSSKARERDLEEEQATCVAGFN